MLLLVTLLGCGVFARANYLRRDNFGIFINENSLSKVQRDLDSLDHLDLSDLGLQTIHEDAFQGCLGVIVKNLSLANNRLRQLPAMVFRGLVNLEYLSLANNSLVRFQYAFGDSAFLKTIDIRNNGIETLYKGSFYGLVPHAKILTDGNYFGQVEAYHYEEPFPLLKLCMADGIVHYIEVVSDAAREEQMELQLCETKYRPFLYDIVSLGLESIKGFKKGWYRLNHLSVTVLDLQLNEIDEITSEMLNDLPVSLSRVNLAWNRIENLEAGVINNMNLRELDLRGNRIFAMDENAFTNTKLSKLELSSQYV